MFYSSNVLFSHVPEPGTPRLSPATSESLPDIEQELGHFDKQELVVASILQEQGYTMDSFSLLTTRCSFAGSVQTLLLLGDLFGSQLVSLGLQNLPRPVSWHFHSILRQSTHHHTIDMWTAVDWVDSTSQ